MSNGELYPGAELIDFRAHLETIVPSGCQPCSFPKSFIDHAIRTLYQTKDPGERQARKAVVEIDARAIFVRPNGDTCPGPKIAYQVDDLQLFPREEDLVCQHIPVTKEVVVPVETPPHLLDSDAYA